ncbi:MAG: hypothetical protein AAB897_03100 [Patescibacteria group bacterium]
MAEVRPEEVVRLLREDAIFARQSESKTVKEKPAFGVLVLQALNHATEGTELKLQPKKDDVAESSEPTTVVVPSLSEYLEEQVKSQKPAYQLLDQVSFYSHRGIEALTDGNFEEFDICATRIKEAWDALAFIKLPKDILWRFDSNTGQEIVEMDQVSFFWPGVRDGELSPENIKHYSTFWGIKPQAWLAGLGDTSSEVGKVMVNYLYVNKTMPIDDQLAMRDRYVQFLSAIQEKFREYKGTPGNIINNTRARFEGFSKQFGRITRFIYEAKERELLLRNQVALQKEG